MKYKVGDVVLYYADGCQFSPTLSAADIKYNLPEMWEQKGYNPKILFRGGNKLPDDWGTLPETTGILINIPVTLYRKIVDLLPYDKRDMNPLLSARGFTSLYFENLTIVLDQ